MNASPRILVIEDDPAIRRGVVDALSSENYDVSEAGDGDTGLPLALEGEFDLILLDLVLPGADGLDILAKVRDVLPTRPVIVMTARGDESDRVRGLKLGADDYVVKPFSVRELLARVEAVLRRSPQRATQAGVIALPGCAFDPSRSEVRFADGTRVELSDREQTLLDYLSRHRQRAISRDEILQNVWRLDPRGVATRTIDMHIARLREKLRDDATEPRILLTVRGKGYMLSLADEVRS
jgi:DNA-binding response OmpR family regulator